MYVLGATSAQQGVKLARHLRDIVRPNLTEKAYYQTLLEETINEVLYELSKCFLLFFTKIKIDVFLFTT